MIKKIFCIFGIILLPCYLLVMYVLLGKSANQVICQEVSIHILDSLDAPYLQKSDVLSLIKDQRKQMMGRAFYLIDTYEVEQLVRKNPVVRDVSCYKTPEGSIRIDITQRAPIIRIMGLSGNYFMDAEGATMPVTHNYTAHVPIVTGYVTPELAQGDLLDFACFLQENAFWQAQIMQIHIHANGEVDLTPRVGRHRIILGSFDQYETKLENLMTFYDKGLNEKGWNVYKAINLKYENQVIGIK